MAGSRTVYRGSRGRFAGASAGKPEKVRSGGFANAAFRARIGSSRKVNGQQNLSASKPPQKKPTAKKRIYKVVGAPNSMKRRKFTQQVALGAAAGVVLGVQQHARLSKQAQRGTAHLRVQAGTRLVGAGVRHEAIPMAHTGVSLRDAAKASFAATKKVGPNYSAAKGTKEFVGRRVTDGNYGFRLQGK